MKGLGIVILLVALAVVAYLVFFFAKQKKLLADTCTYIRGFKVRSFMGANAVIDLNIGIKNKSKIKLKILSQSYKVYINDKIATKITNSNEFTLLSGQEIITPFTLEFNPVDVLNVALTELLANPRAFTIRIKGTASVGLGVLVFNKLPVDMSFTLMDMLKSGKTTTC